MEVACPECGKVLDDRDPYPVHMAEVHGIVASQPTAPSPSAAHASTKPMPCPQCGKVLDERDPYPVHMADVHGMAVGPMHQRAGLALRVEEIEVVAGDVDRPYQVVGPITARVTAGAAWNKARTVEDVNSKLREVALKMGANAVIRANYERGISPTSWKALTATGMAVYVEPSEKKCPYCAELVKAEAIKCKHCGSDLLSS